MGNIHFFSEDLCGVVFPFFFAGCIVVDLHGHGVGVGLLLYRNACLVSCCFIHPWATHCLWKLRVLDCPNNICVASLCDWLSSYSQF